MEPPEFDPQFFWDNLLSRQPEFIQLAYTQLDHEEQKTVIAHLRKMAEEPGWHPEQVISARTALQVLHVNSPQVGE